MVLENWRIERVLRRLKAIAEGFVQAEHRGGVRVDVDQTFGVLPDDAEIVDAVRDLARRVADKKLRPEQIDESLFSDSLQTAGLPDPDLLIRTGVCSRVEY